MLSLLLLVAVMFLLVAASMGLMASLFHFSLVSVDTARREGRHDDVIVFSY